MKEETVKRISADDGMYLRKGDDFYKEVYLPEGESASDYTEVPEKEAFRFWAEMPSDKFKIGVLSRGVTQEQLDGLSAEDKAVLDEPIISRRDENVLVVLQRLGLTVMDFDGIFGLNGGGDG